MAGVKLVRLGQSEVCLQQIGHGAHPKRRWRRAVNNGRPGPHEAGGFTMGNLERYSNQAALVGRLFYSSMFLLLGYSKLTDFAGTVGYMGSLGLPAPSLATVIAIVIEIGAGLLVLIIAFIGHSQLSDPNTFQHFMKNMAIVGGSLAFVAFGGGAYSLDARKP
jgi:putative oxidoreductase